MNREKRKAKSEKDERTDEQNYIRATKPHSKIAFKFHTVLGTVQLHYLRSAIFGLGSVKCWVDDDVDKGVTVIAYWKEIINIGRYVFLLFSSLVLIPGSPLWCCSYSTITFLVLLGHSEIENMRCVIRRTYDQTIME